VPEVKIGASPSLINVKGAKKMRETIQDLLQINPISYLSYDKALPIFIYLAIALIVSVIPIVKACFSIWNTLLLNIISDIAAGRKIRSIKKKKQLLEGEADGKTLKAAFHMYLGHTGALIAATGLFYLVSKQQYEFIFYILIGLLGLSLLFWIRSFVGFVWAILSIAMLTAPLYYGDETIIMHGAIFLAAIILVQSVLGSFVQLKSSVSNRKLMKGKGIFGRLKWVPAMMFGVVLIGQSLYAGFFIVTTFLS